MGELVVVGLSHRTAPVGVRERLAFPAGELEASLRQLCALPAVTEGLILSTCNRVEVYVAGGAGAMAAAALRSFIATTRGVDGATLSAHLYEHAGVAAVRHAFRVAASLDSLVVGEPQILGQLKDAYGAAARTGTLGSLLGRCLERAFSVAKRVRTETGIARNAASVSSAAVELAQQIFGDLAGKLVLVVGAGKMSGLAARHLRGAGCADVLVTNRSAERAVELAREIDGKARPFETLDQMLVLVDVVISSTGAPEPILTRARLKPIMRQRRHRPLFLIDIAVPRDVAADAADLDGVFLYDVDSLEAVVADNLRGRMREAEQAERIVDDEVSRFARWLEQRDIGPTIRALRQKADLIARAELERTPAGLPSLDERARRSLQAMTSAIVNKLLHAPTTALKDPRRGEEMATAVRDLFALEVAEVASEGEAPVATPAAQEPVVK